METAEGTDTMCLLFYLSHPSDSIALSTCVCVCWFVVVVVFAKAAFGFPQST